MTRNVAEMVATWSMAPVVEAYQALRGVALLTAVTFVAEIGDVRRFESPRQLMAYLGLVPCESSTGERVRRGRITQTGHTRGPRVAIGGGRGHPFSPRGGAGVPGGRTKPAPSRGGNAPEGRGRR